MMWPFRKKPVPPAPIPPTSWRAGDMAECVSGPVDGIWLDPVTAGPARGSVGVVDRTRWHTNTNSEYQWGISFAAFPGCFYAAHNFRKIVRTHEAADAEFTALIRKSRKEPAQ